MKRLIIIALFLVPSQLQAQNIWDSIADFGAGQRQRAVSFSLNGYGYVGTGLDTADACRADMWKYNPIQGTWSQVANVPGPGRRNGVAFTIGDKAYVGTGVDNASAPIGNKLNDFYEYNDSTNTWRAIANYPLSLYFATAFGVASKGYVCGGKLDSDTYTPELYEYKPSTNRWISRSDFPGGVRYQMISFAVDGFAYLGLGADEDIYRRDWYKYNPGSNTWTQMNNFAGNERAAAVTFVINGRGYIAMGTDGGYRDDVWEYNHDFDTWISREKFPGKGRKFGSAFTIGDTAYVGIGKASDGGKRSFNKYYPASYSTVEEIKDPFSLSPNPIQDHFRLSNLPESAAWVTIMNLNGQKVWNSEVKKGIYNCKGLSKGVYLLAIKDEDNMVLQHQKIVIE